MNRIKIQALVTSRFLITSLTAIILITTLSRLLFCKNIKFQKGFGDFDLECTFFPIRRPSRSDNNIFFIETSCLYNNNTSEGEVVLTDAQACAIYSAAVQNPNRYVMLLQSCYLKFDYFERSRRGVQELLKLPNVAVARFDEEEINSHLKLEYNAPILNTTSDLRYVQTAVLLIYGGTYIDLNLISQKPIQNLKGNFIGIDPDTKQLDLSFLQFSYKQNGHKFLKLVISLTKKDTPMSSIMAKAIKLFCNVSQIPGYKITTTNLGRCDISIFPKSVIYSPGDNLDIEKLVSAYVVRVKEDLSNGNNTENLEELVGDYCLPVYRR